MAKTYKNLFEKIVSFENLLLAACRAQKGKRFNLNTGRFNFFLEKELFKLQEELKNKTYKTGKYRQFFVHDPKKRLISAAPYRDRVIHHAFCNIIEPIFDKTFIDDSFACQIGKGTHRAIFRCQSFLRKNRYALQCDIQKYFPSINHNVLFDILTRKIKDQKTLWLGKLIIDSAKGLKLLTDEEAKDNNLYNINSTGMPIGNLTSQFFANLYLNELDYFVKFNLRERYYIRYMDDFLVFHNDKVHLSKLRSEIAQFLESRLKLKLHPKKSTLFPIRLGVAFLGFRLFKDYRRLKKENVKRFLKRMKKLQKLFSEGLISTNEISNSLRCWLAHASYGNTYNLRKKILPKIDFARRSLSKGRMQ